MAREKGMGNLQQEKSKNYATEGLTLRCKFWPNSKSKSKSEGEVEQMCLSTCPAGQTEATHHCSTSCFGSSSNKYGA